MRKSKYIKPIALASLAIAAASLAKALQDAAAAASLEPVRQPKAPAAAKTATKGKVAKKKVAKRLATAR